MKRVCAWCGKLLGESKGGPEGDVSHGICDDCLKKTLAGERTQKVSDQEIAQASLASPRGSGDTQTPGYFPAYDYPDPRGKIARLTKSTLTMPPPSLTNF